MARLPKPATAEPPQPESAACGLPAWILEGRWTGDRRFHLHDHECDRALWYAGRWALPRGPALKRLTSFQPIAAVVAQPVPPPQLVGVPEMLLCGSCPYRAVCREDAPLASNCRTCRHVVAGGGLPQAATGWRCGLDAGSAERDRVQSRELGPDEQRAGCPAWRAAA